MRIAGYKELSLVDVVDHTSFVVWFSFCNFNCPWCYNKEIALGKGEDVSVEFIIEKLKDAIDFVDYLHVTGGEPTLQFDELKELFERSHEIGMKNSLNTNSSNPDRVKKLKFEHVATDIKARPENYPKVIGLKEFDFSRIEESMYHYKEKVPFVEVRTTVVPSLVDKEDVYWIANWLKDVFDDYNGRLVYVIQQFQPFEGIRDERFRNAKPTDEKFLEELGKKVREKYGLEVYLRTFDGIKKLR